MDSRPRKQESPLRFLPGLLALAALAATRLYSYALFHALAEMFAVAVQFGLFTVVWHSRRHVESGALLLIGTSAAAVAALDALHLLTFDGGGPIPASSDVPAQLWMAARILQAGSILVASRSIGCKPVAWHVLAATSAAGAAVVAAAATGALAGLIGSAGIAALRLPVDVATTLALALALHSFSRRTDAFPREVAGLVQWSVAATIASQTLIMLSRNPASVLHLVGHILRIVGAYALYRAVVTSVLEEPQAMLFREISLRNARLEDTQRALRRAKERSDAMSSVAAMIARGEELDAIIAHTFTVCCQTLGADGAALAAVEGPGFVVTHAHGFDGTILGMRADAQSGRHVRLAIEKQAPVIVNDPDHDPRVDRASISRYGITSLIVTPLLAGSEALGALVFVKRKGRGGFDEHDRGFVGRLGTALALAIANERLRSSQARVADALRSAILSMPDALPGIRLGHVYRSADRLARIGGDFYDAFPVADGLHAVLMGDVSGKGVDAAVSSFVTRTAFHALALRESSPAAVMSAVNQVLARLLPEGAFATAVFGLVDTDARVFMAASAGHPDPLVCEDGRCVEHDVVRSMPLGMFPDARYEEFTIPLSPESILVLFSDGVLDARRGQEPFGESRVRETLHSVHAGDPQEVADRLLAAVTAFADGTHADDIAIVTLRLA